MTTSVFGIPVPSSADWDDASTYTFYRKGADSGASAAAPHMGAIGRSAAPVPAFHTNLVVVREPLSGRTLDGVVAAQRESITKRFPAAKLARQGASKPGGAASHEMEFTVPLPPPLPALKQWYCTTVRGEHAYHFCGSATQATYDAERPRFLTFVEEWARTAQAGATSKSK